MRKFSTTAFVVVLLVFMVAVPAGAKKSMTSLCHAEGDGSFRVLVVAGNALPAHRNHGDGLVGDPVPGMNGYVFSGDCTPVVADTDGDGIPDTVDNCPTRPNPDQADRYGSPAGDACEDSDGNGTADVDEPNICVHLNGFQLLKTGTATCVSTATTGSGANFAIATGPFSNAQALNGNSTTVVATGDNAIAFGGFGDGNTATVTANYGIAEAHHGDRNTATVTGNGIPGYHSIAFAGLGHDNTAIASGVQSRAWAHTGNGNHATALGTCQVFAVGGGQTNSCGP